VIIVSWIKKIINKLSDEDEQLEEYVAESEVEEKATRPEKHILNNRAVNKSRDVEARMTYQYPKGNFRFPLISDGEDRQEKRPVRKRHEPEKNEKREAKQGEVREIQRKPRKTQMQNAANQKGKPSAHSHEKSEKISKTKKVEKGNSRPFRPTEIPSPIYGFRTRPVKPIKKGDVEYELNEFLHSGNEKEHDEVKHEVYPPELNQLNEVNEREQEKEIEEEHERIQESGGWSGVEASLIGNEFSFRENEDERKSPSNQDTVEDPDEIAIAPAERLQSEISSAAALEESKWPEPPSGKWEEQERPEVEQKDGVIQLTPSEELQTPESSQQSGDLEAEEPALVGQNLHTEQPEDQTRHEEMKQPAAAVQTQENTHVDDPETKKEEPKPRKRSHLPFNVLMLKQDKRQMNHRHRTKAVTERNPEPHMPENRDGSSQEKEIASAEQQSSFPENTSVSRRSEDIQGEDAAKSYSELSSEVKRTKGYTFPEMEYLMPPVSKKLSGEWLEAQKNLLDETLHNFNVRAKVVNVTQGPSVTRFEVQPEPGVKVNKITNLSDDIKLSLAAKDIRIEAPIPGKHTIGIEVPNKESRPVCISEVIASPAFQESESVLTAALGLDISGQPIVTDLSKMPHGLIAGATGSGKSVCINSILVSLLYKASPDELKMLLIDPKMVELAPYNRIPHLVSPVITDVKAATAALKWAVEEMERRYELFAHTGVRDIKRFNELAKRNKQYNDTLPYLVIVIDELADLMMMSPADVEEAICRIAQKARACGIHLIIATQRPSVDVITGLIKANVPTRVAFSVSSGVDSRTIIDGSGAERLLGRGDMLFLENGSGKPVRLQGTFVSDDEIDDIINHVRNQREPEYIFQQDELIKKAQVMEEEDELFFEACEFVIDQGGASASSLQRRFRIGYNRAARLMEMMEKSGVISESRGSKPRDVLISESELETLA
jgi:DNA segregation ATPase FtsK/SpoIIIE, S-DNA-T family